MQQALKGRKNFETKIENDPIEMKKVISKHALAFGSKKYDMQVISEAVAALWSTKQGPEETLLAYIE